MTATMGQAMETTPRAVVDEIAADLETPVGAFLKLRGAGARFLLESAETGGALGRHSFIGFGSTEIEGGRDGTVRVHGPHGVSTEVCDDPLDAIQSRLAGARPEADPPGHLLGGAVGMIAYDYVQTIERLPNAPPASGPLCRFVIVDSLVVFDHLKHRAAVLTRVGDGGRARAEAKNRVLLEALAGGPPGDAPDPAGEVVFEPVEPKQAYLDAVAEAKTHILAGDIFQVVLSRSERVALRCDPFRIYRALRMGNPSPYMFYLDFGERKLVGSSPEMLVKLEGRRALLSPIAGTRPRGQDPDQDASLASDLLADEKERAEHVMLVDLARNDLGRVARTGCVEVNHAMRIEKFSHVQHIVSDVTAGMAEGTDAFDLLRAAFPAGTVTGAPKIRAMEIINELERDNREAYAGCVGYVSPGGDMDACLTIRTIQIEGDTATLRAGAGIVADSDPEREFQETEDKLAALKEAVRIAVEGGP